MRAGAHLCSTAGPTSSPRPDPKTLLPLLQTLVTRICASLRPLAHSPTERQRRRWGRTKVGVLFEGTLSSGSVAGRLSRLEVFFVVGRGAVRYPFWLISCVGERESWQSEYARHASYAVVVGAVGWEGSVLGESRFDLPPKSAPFPRSFLPLFSLRRTFCSLYHLFFQLLLYAAAERGSSRQEEGRMRSMLLRRRREPELQLRAVRCVPRPLPDSISHGSRLDVSSSARPLLTLINPALLLSAKSLMRHVACGGAMKE